MKKVNDWIVGVVVVLALVLASRVTQAASVPVEGASFNVEATTADNLKVYVGKRIIVVLNSGKELFGTLKAVSGNHLHIAELEGVDYFDALVRTENVVAVKARFRMSK
ncbi:MAG: hypothetical protein CVU64_12820 [Deltaproteobacteria bacterium HGW-Deltaproteobacteria-21]|nr:MAG: hypothetical protein CVU64_12820 [Deltaproteobacteria bacterium HGW-Deltaproteobacteria-21]